MRSADRTHNGHAGPCFPDCPGWRLECGHHLDACRPGCWGWGGVAFEPIGRRDLAALPVDLLGGVA